MIINNLEEIKNKFFFAIIIGSGPAGISTALGLEEKKIESLIIEAGGLNYDEKNIRYLEGAYVGDSDYATLPGSRGRQFGGTGNFWGGNCNPIQEEEFNNWPIKKINLDKYIVSAKKILNLKNNFFLEKFSNNLDLYNRDWSNVKFGDKYFDYIKKSKYINLSLNTIYQGSNGDNGKITSINCFKKENYKLKSKYFILSCGGVENSRLLLWTKNNNPKLFKHDLPIGNYYMDHPFYSVAEGLVNYKKLQSYNKKNNIKKAPLITCASTYNLSCNKNFIKDKKIINSGLYIRFENANKYDSIFKQVRCMAPNFIKEIYENKTVKDTYKITINILQEQEPIFDRKITLNKNSDPLGIPLPEVHWWKTELERKSARIITEEAANFFLKNDIARIGIEEYLFNKDKYDTKAGYHQLGGTRMGSNTKDSVVDKDLKVHGISNLFINGSSVFRTGSYNHPTYTIVKLALRLSNHLSKL
jgi:hypothetical protein